MQQPTGFESNDKALVCKLRKALYMVSNRQPLEPGLRGWVLPYPGNQVWFQVHQMWSFVVHSSWVQALSNCPCQSDDSIVTDSSMELIQKLITKLNFILALKHMGVLDYWYWRETPKGWIFLLSQAKYIRGSISQSWYVTANNISPPTMGCCKLFKYGTNHI